MPENIQEEPIVNDEILDPMPGPTPEEEEEWERQRIEEWEKKIAPFRALREAIDQHDEAIIDAQYDIDMLKMEG